MQNFRPTVKSGQWQVHGPRDRHHKLTLAFMLTLTLAVTQSISHLGVSTQALFPWAKQMGACRRFFPMSIALGLLRRVWLPHLWNFILGSWVGNAWLNGKHQCCQTMYVREWGIEMQAANPCWMSIISWTAFKTKYAFSSERIPLTKHIPSSLKYLQTVNLLPVWKLIIRQLIQLSYTGRINSIYLPVISNNCCLKRMKQNMID